MLTAEERNKDQKREHCLKDVVDQTVYKGLKGNGRSKWERDAMRVAKWKKIKVRECEPKKETWRILEYLVFRAAVGDRVSQHGFSYEAK